MTDNAAVLARLGQVRQLIEQHEGALSDLYPERTELLEQGVALGIPSAKLADVAGVSRGRVSQVSPRPKAAEAVTATAAEPEPAPEKPAHPSCVTSVDELVVTLGTRTALSDRYSTHQAKPYGRRPTIWVDVHRREWIAEIGAFPEPLPGDTLADVLRVAFVHQATRVFLVGPPPVHDDEPGDAGIRAWFLADPGQGWSVAATGHHLSDARTPTARYVWDDGQTVEIMRTAAWWGDEDESAGVARNAWFALQEKIQEQFGDSARLLATPATTGRDLWQRTIGPKTTYPVLSDEVRELIHATAGQGRIELCRPPHYDWAARGLESRLDLPEVPGVHVRDGRLMYAALTWGMPVGAPTLLTGEAIDMMPAAQLQRAIMGRSRWQVMATVPRDWDRPFGLLMAPREGDTGWRYPAEPGETFLTWCDGSELALATANGWRCELIGGMTWKEGKPLNSWTEKLLGIWESFAGHPYERLCRRAIRSLLLFSIGAFASRGRPVTYTLPESRANEVPAGVPVHRAGDMLVWTQEAPATSWSQQLAHPEWSATIWARARVRLLDGPGVPGQSGQRGSYKGRTGALHLPPGVDVLGFRTDALILTGDPGWPDDGKAGRLRPDGEISGPFEWPETETELLRLKTAAQNAARGNR